MDRRPDASGGGMEIRPHAGQARSGGVPVSQRKGFSDRVRRSGIGSLGAEVAASAALPRQRDGACAANAGRLREPPFEDSVRFLKSLDVSLERDAILPLGKKLRLQLLYEQIEARDLVAEFLRIRCGGRFGTRDGAA